MKTGLTPNFSGWHGPEWPPAGSMGSVSMMGLSPGGPGGLKGFGTSPYGKSVDMVDMCQQLMDAGGETVAPPCGALTRACSRPCSEDGGVLRCVWRQGVAGWCLGARAAPQLGTDGQGPTGWVADVTTYMFKYSLDTQSPKR